MLKKEVIGPNIYSNHDIIRGAGVFDEVTGDRAGVIIIIMRNNELLYTLGPITSFVSIVTDEHLRGRNVFHFNLFQLLRDCSTITPPPQLITCKAFKNCLSSRLQIM